ncbi:MAG: hypothetical protein H0X41_03590 [Chitinophagaceae bacterium]|nr:hypothetical protein [Chitinophagaceae bacterium]
MEYEQFVSSLNDSEPPQNISLLLRALWYDGREEWESSHNIAQNINDRNGSWVHAYLHRKEGDLSNARYWYHKAGKSDPSVSLKEEWKMLVRAFL